MTDVEQTPLERRAAEAASLKAPKLKRGIAELLRDVAPTDAEMMADLTSHRRSWDDDPADRHDIVAELRDRRRRAAIFAAAPELSDDLERLWRRGGEFPAASHALSPWSIQPPFHDGDETSPPRAVWDRLLRPMLAGGRQYRADLEWMLRHAALLAEPAAVGTAVALAIDDGDRSARRLLDELLDTPPTPEQLAEGAGRWSEAFHVGLLRQRDPAAWARAHALLLAAGSHEGTRQSLLTIAGEASPQAFVATLGVALEHELERFGSTVLVAGRWLDRELRAADRAGNRTLLTEARALLTDPARRAQAIAEGTPDDLRLALWALAVTDASAAATQAALIRASDPGLERRAVAVHHLAATPHCGVDDLVEAFSDPDLRIVTHALDRLAFWPDGPPADVADAALALLPRLPAKATKLPPLGPLPERTTSRSTAARLVINQEHTPHLDALAAQALELDATTRHHLLEHHGERLVDGHRALVLRLVGDASSWVRDAAAELVKDLTLTGAEVADLEALLTRKAGDLRANVLALLEALEPPAAAAAAARLAASGNEAQRQAGAELQGRLGADAGAEPTEDDGFGLVDPAALTPPIAPVEPGTAIAGKDVDGLLSGVDAFVEEHATIELVLTPTETDDSDPGGGAQEPTTTTVSELAEWELRSLSLPPEFDALRRRTVDALLRKHGGKTAPSVLLARAVQTCELAVHEPWMPVVEDDPWRARALRGIRRLSVRHGRAVHALLTGLATEVRDASAIDWALDAAESLLLVPGADPEHTLDRGMQLLVSLQRPMEWFTEATPAFTDEQARRLWGLSRWVMDVADPITPESLSEWDRSDERRSSRIPRRPDTGLVTAMFDRGIATEADLLDHLVGPRPVHAEWGALAELSGPPPEEWYQRDASEPVRAVARRARERVVAVELTRGEATTAATAPARTLTESGGADVLVGALVALGKGKLKRTSAWGDSTRATIFSHLIRASVPGEHDTPERVAALLGAAALPRTRLLEVACYAPQWAGHVEQALTRPGLEDAVWWVHAHTKDGQWDVPWGLRSRWRREIATRTELTDEDLTDGAVDVDWFARVRAGIGPSGLAEVLGTARLASSGGGHKRAELFALAIEGKVPLKELRERIDGKRHQDAVRALGLRPLSPRRTAADLRERYEAIQAFVRESRQFGSQRQESERRAAEIGLANLARTAGYRDPLRLAWAMEAAATADLAGGAEVLRGDVSVRLGVDDAGRPALTVRRGDRALKAVPAPLRKDPEIAALTARRTELTRIASRVRDGLESAMVRGDHFSGDELAALREHVVLWPQLRRLLLVIVDGSGAATAVGFPGDDGRALQDLAAEHPVAPTAELRIAHPVDLIAGGRWSDWQRHVLGAELRQPFKQVFRELYLPVAAETELGGVGTSRRYAGHQVRAGQAQRLLTGRGWIVEGYEPPTRTLRHEDLFVEIDLALGWGTAAEVEPPAVDLVRFSRLSTGAPLALTDVPARAFSELMRDLDLVVSVAHAAGVDPEPSLSTIESRAALLRETAALLGLHNVQVEERRAVVEGTLSTYAVHLGSAQVSRLPGGSVCIVPVHAQQRGRVFLPFADDDPRTAEVLAKVLLLARDEEIKDPVILDQLR